MVMGPHVFSDKVGKQQFKIIRQLSIKSPRKFLVSKKDQLTIFKQLERRGYIRILSIKKGKRKYIITVARTFAKLHRYSKIGKRTYKVIMSKHKIKRRKV